MVIYFNAHFTVTINLHHVEVGGLTMLNLQTTDNYILLSKHHIARVSCLKSRSHFLKQTFKYVSSKVLLNTRYWYLIVCKTRLLMLFAVYYATKTKQRKIIYSFYVRANNNWKLFVTPTNIWIKKILRKIFQTIQLF